MNQAQAISLLEGFFLDAVMQQDPFLEEFHNLPDEPPETPTVRYPYKECVDIFCGNQSLANHYYKAWNHLD